MPWGTPKEIERRRRIRLAVWAYAYEALNETLVPDEVFDKECLLVDLTVSTGHPQMDTWFKRNFAPSTGMWVRKHPGRARLHQIATDIINDRSQSWPEPAPSGSSSATTICP